MMDIRVGDIICAKTITHRIVVEMKESKSGKQKPLTNSFSYGFQSEHNLLSQVGVFLYLGAYPEQVDGSITQKWAEQALQRLGWTNTDLADGK